MLKEQQEAPVGKFSSDKVRILTARLLDAFQSISADVGAGGPDVLQDHGPMSVRPRSRRFCCGLPEPQQPPVPIHCWSKHKPGVLPSLMILTYR